MSEKIFQIAYPLNLIGFENKCWEVPVDLFTGYFNGLNIKSIVYETCFSLSKSNTQKYIFETNKLPEDYLNQKINSYQGIHWI